MTTPSPLPAGLDAKRFREKALGCWLGKAIGGTLGMPFEGKPGTHDLTFYDPVPTEAVPNDDLDLQVLWACLLDKKPVINHDLFADGWLNHVAFPWDEYGVAIRNLRLGVPAPHSGFYDNYYVDGMGAAIRTEIWACLAPGNPALAADYAETDASVDHHGDGVYAARFLAALESAAFVEGDAQKLIDAALKTIPAESRLARALRDTREWCNGQGADAWLAVREKIVGKWGHENFTDVVMNLCFIELALLLGGLDFDRTLCMAVNCGKDTDCTGATIGSILGIMKPELITDKWMNPISRRLIVDKRITGITPPTTLDEFTDLVLALRGKTAFAPVPVPAFDPMKFAVPADIATVPSWPAGAPSDQLPKTLVMPKNAVATVFPGQKGSIPASAAPIGGACLLRFVFTLAKSEEVRVVFNTHAHSAVYLDGNLAFARAAGPMNPSPHRVPEHQRTDVALEAGKHELIAVVAAPPGAGVIEWVVTVGDKATLQWLPTFRPNGQW